MLLDFVTLVILSTMCNVHGNSDYQYFPKAIGWFKLHKVTETWQTALSQCENEGAILASPINQKVLNVMMSLILNNNASLSYFIGTHAKFSPRKYVSVEGVPIDNMPVMDRFQVLNSEDGECLNANGFNISVVSCTASLPYICYKHQEAKTLQCEILDKGYQLEPTTGSCYKIQRHLLSWRDAYTSCISEGGYLAILNDAHEANLVKNMVTAKKPESWEHYWEPFYIGLRGWNNNGTFMTIHGEHLEQVYNVWEYNQPDKSDQLCGAITRNGKLDNIGCYLTKYSICEMNPKYIRFPTAETDKAKLSL